MNIVKVEFRKLSRGLLVFTLVLCGLTVMYLGFFESVNELFVQKMDMMPEVLLGMFRLDDLSQLAGYNNYYATIVTFLVLGAACYACITGAMLFIREEAEGTIEFLGSRPVSRARIVAAKLAVSAAALLIIVLAMATTGWVCGLLFSGGADFERALMGISLLCYLPMFVFWAIGCLLSVTLRKAASATPIGLGLLFFTYVLGAIAGMVEPLSFLKWLSPMDYVPTTQLATSGFDGLDFTGLLLGLVLIAGCLVATLFTYRRRDLAT